MQLFAHGVESAGYRQNCKSMGWMAGMYSVLDIANGMTTQRANHLVTVLPRSLMAIRVNEVAKCCAGLFYGGAMG